MKVSIPMLLYLGQIWWNLPGNWEQKQQILSPLVDCVRDFVSDYPGADYTAIISRFGSPRQVVSSWVGEMEIEELSQALNVRRRALNIVTAVVLTALLVWVGVMGIAIRNAQPRTAVSFVKEIKIIEHYVFN